MTPQQQLETFYAKYDAPVVRTARAALRRMRQQFPGATALVYDNYNALVIGFVPGDRPSDAILSIALYPRWVTLFFIHGADLPDPHKLLQGSGKMVRGIRLDRVEMLVEPAVQELIKLPREARGWRLGRGSL